MIPGSKGLPPHEPAQVRVDSNLNSYTKKEKKCQGLTNVKFVATMSNRI